MTTPATPMQDRNRHVVVAWFVAAVCAAAAVVFGMRYAMVRSENAVLTQRQAATETLLKSTQMELESERILSAAIAAEYKKLNELKGASGTKPAAGEPE